MHGQIRFFALLLMAWGQFLPVAVAQTTPVQKQTRVAAPPDVTLVGLLTRQYRGRCGADGQHKWDDEHWEVGFVRLQVPATLDLSPLEGKAVVVTGKGKELPPPREVEHVHEAPSLNPLPDGPGIECPQVQMRSDWVIGKNGFRIMRQRSAGLPMMLDVTSAKLFSGVEIEVHGESLAVTVTNVLDAAVNDVKVVLHYEGCYGKPGSDSRSQTTAVLPAGGRIETTFPAIVAEDQGQWGIRNHRAYSLQILGAKGPVLFDCDLPLGLFQATGIECPKE
jgi:hypothetical protein